MTRFVVLFVGALWAFSPATPTAIQDPLTLVITRNGDPPTGVTVLVLLNGEKRKDDGASLKAVAGKHPKGTNVDVYRWVCEDGKIQLIIAPAGEALGVEDKDCLKTKEPPPGNPCRCGWIGGFKLGDVTTIDAEAGRVK